MNDPGAPDILLCPRCQGENLALSPGVKQAPAFCLQCRFPLMLVANKYRLLRVLGRGGFGTVYEARHIHLTREEERVVKVLHPELIEDQALRRRFLREIQVTCLLSQRNHHIVRIYDDFGEMPGLGFYYVMEHLKGAPLNELLAQYPEGVPLSLVAHLFSQLCVALQAAHLEGIIHRDLKPANLYVVQHLEDERFLKVLDFGIARAQRAHAETKRLTDGVIGTPAYMAPEQCMNEEVGPATDIYAMGVILFELLAGHLPFATEPSHTPSAAELITSHLMADAPRLHDVLAPGREVPVGVSDVLAKALAKEPQERFADARSFQAAFAAALGQTSDAASPPLPSLPSPVEAPTRPMVALGGLPTGQLEQLPAKEAEDPALASTQIALPPFAGPVPSGDALEASPPQPVHTDPELRPMATPYQSIPGVARLARTTPSDVAGALQEAPETDPLEPPEAGGSLTIVLLGVTIFLLAGVAAWLWKQPTLPWVDAPPKRAVSQAALRNPLREPLRARVGTPQRRPSLPVPTQRERPVSTRKRAAPIRRKAAPTRRAPLRHRAPRRRVRRRVRPVRRPVVRRSVPRPRPIGAADTVPGCPVMPGYQVFLHIVKGRSLHLSFSGGMGRTAPHKKGYCVAVVSTRVQLLIKGSGFRAYTPCRLRLWGGPKRLRITMFDSRQGGLEPEDEDYCKR